MNRLLIDNTLRVIIESAEGARIINRNIKKAEIETLKRNKQHKTKRFEAGTVFKKSNGITYAIVKYSEYFGQYECYNAEGNQTTFYTYEQLKKIINK